MGSNYSSISNFNDDLVNPTFKLEHGWVITSAMLLISETIS